MHRIPQVCPADPPQVPERRLHPGRFPHGRKVILKGVPGLHPGQALGLEQSKFRVPRPRGQEGPDLPVHLVVAAQVQKDQQTQRGPPFPVRLLGKEVEVLGSGFGVVLDPVGVLSPPRMPFPQLRHGTTVLEEGPSPLQCLQGFGIPVQLQSKVLPHHPKPEGIRPVRKRLSRRLPGSFQVPQPLVRRNPSHPKVLGA